VSVSSGTGHPGSPGQRAVKQLLLRVPGIISFSGNVTIQMVC